MVYLDYEIVSNKTVVLASTLRDLVVSIFFFLQQYKLM